MSVFKSPFIFHPLALTSPDPWYRALWEQKHKIEILELKTDRKLRSKSSEKADTSGACK